MIFSRSLQAVPVANNYSFWMIDIPEHGSLGKEDGSSPAVISDVVELVEVGDRVIGRSTSKGLFILNTRSGELHAFRESEAVQEKSRLCRRWRALTPSTSIVAGGCFI